MFRWTTGKCCGASTPSTVAIGAEWSALLGEESEAWNRDQGTQPDSDGNLYQDRALPDGSHHRVIENWLQPDELRALLEPHAAVIELEEFDRDWFVCYELRA